MAFVALPAVAARPAAPLRSTASAFVAPAAAAAAAAPRVRAARLLPTMAVTVGEPAPAFTLPTDGGGSLSLSDLAGKKVVLYFYPRDDTPGCTVEAQGFRDAADRLAAAGAVVIGVSPDSTASHDAFKAKYGLNFALVSDVDDAKPMLSDYGVWQLRQKFGKEFMGVSRSTFVIDAAGRVAREWLSVVVDGHVEEVVSYVESL